MCTEFNINYIYRRMNFSSWYCSLVPWPSHNAPQTFAEHCGKARVPGHELRLLVLVKYLEPDYKTFIHSLVNL